MKATLLALSLTLAACDNMPLDEANDASADVRPLVDTSLTPDTETPCTVWGRVSTCPDGTIGCDRMICLSRDPSLPSCPTSLPCK